MSRARALDMLMVTMYVVMAFIGVALLIDPSPAMGGQDSTGWLDEVLRCYGAILLTASALGALARAMGLKYSEAAAVHGLGAAQLLRVVTDWAAYGVGYWVLYWLAAFLALIVLGLSLPVTTVPQMLAALRKGAD